MTRDIDIHDAAAISINRAAIVAKCSRETIRKLIVEHDIQPLGKKNGKPFYPLFDVIAAAAGKPSKGRQQANVRDPATLPASERNAFYQSEARRLDLEERAGNLIQADEARRGYEELVKEFVGFLEILPDVLERNANMSPIQVEAMIEAINIERERLYRRRVSKRLRCPAQESRPDIGGEET